MSAASNVVVPTTVTVVFFMKSLNLGKRDCLSVEGICVFIYARSLVWPWPWPHDLGTPTWPRYCEDVCVYRKWSL